MGRVLSPRDTKVTFRDEELQRPGDVPVVTAPASGCPPFKKGSFSIDAYQLYPENMDWDAKLCQVYVGILFNASFGIYDAYQDKLDVISFPGSSLVKEFHVGGVAWDKHSGLASVIVGQGNAFETSGANISGDNFIKKYDPRTRKFLWSLNVTALTKGVYGGFNDITHDAAGNTYFCGTFPSSILKVDPQGTTVVPWYLPETVNHTIRGYSGIAIHGNTIITLDSLTGKFFRFDATAATGTPIPVPHTPDEPIIRGDAIRLPLKYGGKVLLVAQNTRGVAVLRSKDASWTSVEYLGLIPTDPSLPLGALTTSATQIGDHIYAVTDWFADPVVPGTVAGNKTSFPMVDITGKIDELLGQGKRRKHRN
ncbi:hypothetical protein B0H67DRAFT_479299 [Lasiosphaeris hirsuta]|uniref:Uncharacterized protein n=1 Tax=Lasiosphaeris hirsuta TaxID=260670 RepID=A0AA40BD80_9PEZI|nr:hypothetical protein B0H67DRAFT_479299 [Lasiosphaeris hirsuta]